MGKKINGYKNPVTGEEDWVDSDTIDKAWLQPRFISLNGTDQLLSTMFKFEYDKEKDTVKIVATCVIEGTSYSGSSREVLFEDFSDRLVKVVYDKDLIDDDDYFKALKDEAQKNIGSLFIGKKNSYIRTDARLVHDNIIGFITLDGTKIATIDSAVLNVEKDTLAFKDFPSVANNENVTLSIDKCYSITDILKIIGKCQIELYIDGMKLTVKNLTLVGNSKQDICISLIMYFSKFDLVKEDPPEFKKFKEYDFNSEDFCTEFVRSRISLLNVNGTEENDNNDIDDRFDDLL